MGEKLGADVNPLIPVVEGSTPEIAQPYIWLDSIILIMLIFIAALPGRSLMLCIRYVVSRLGGEGMLLRSLTFVRGRPFGADGCGDDCVQCDGGMEG